VYVGDATTYPLIEFRGIYGDQLGLLMPLQLEEAGLVLHNLTQQESEQLIVVSRLREIFTEALLSEGSRKQVICQHSTASCVNHGKETCLRTR
jgi:hypothetical protein